MKVLHILYKLMPSGAEKMLADAAELFQEQGVEGWILANDDVEGEYASVLRERGYRIVCIPWRENHAHLMGFWRLCRRERFDAVHIHVIRGYLSFALVAKLAGVGTVLKSFHGIFKARDPLRWLVHSGKRVLSRLAGVKMLAISKSVRDNEKGVFKNPCRLAWNFANEAGFPIADAKVGARIRAELKIAEDAFVLLTVGNCHSASHYTIKNHALVIRALARLPDEIRKRIVYLHVGAELEGCPERQLAGELGVSGQVKFLGSRRDVYELLSATNVYIMSSLHEGLGNSTIEAAFAGREMILTNVPGLRDFGAVISDGIDYCDLTPESMADAIEKKFLTMSGDMRGCIDMRNAALKVFSMPAGVARLVKLYGGADAG